jgi:hypothetical protein
VRYDQFARVGERIATLRVGVVGLHGDEGRWLPIDIPEEGCYFGRVEWAGNSDEVLVEKLRMTPQDQPGTHEYDFSPDAKWAFHTYSTLDSPPIVELVELSGHRAEGKLLMITGSGETNTHIQIIEGLVDRLIELGKPFD